VSLLTKNDFHQFERERGLITNKPKNIEVLDFTDLATLQQGCQSFLGTIYQSGQMTTEVPDAHRIYPMVVIFSK
jgi:hypothetical protein